MNLEAIIKKITYCRGVASPHGMNGDVSIRDGAPIFIIPKDLLIEQPATASAI